MPVKLNSTGGGSVTLTTPSTASDFTLTAPAQTATLITNSSAVLDIGSGQIYKDASGNVGIGTSSPASKLSVSNASSVQIQATTGAVDFRIQSIDAGAAAYAGTVSNHAYVFTTTNSERMRIDSSGNLLVGRTNTDFTNPGLNGLTVFPTQGICFTKNNSTTLGACMYLQRVTGIGTGNLVEFAYGTGLVGSISTNGTGTTYGTASDYRLKENVQPMTGALSVVSALKPCTYTWKVDGSDGQGFIAHELQEVVPDCVTGEKDAVNEDGSIKPQGIDQSKLVPLLTAALQEALTEIASLKARLTALEAK